MRHFRRWDPEVKDGAGSRGERHPREAAGLRVDTAAGTFSKREALGRLRLPEGA